MTLDELEIEALSVEVRVLWDDDVLHVAHLTPPRSYYVGEEPGCDYVVPSDLLGGKERVALSLGATERLVLEGGLTFEVSSVNAGPVVAGRTAFEGRPIAAFLVSALAHAALLAAMLFFGPPAPVDTAEVSMDTRVRIQKVIADAYRGDPTVLEPRYESDPRGRPLLDRHDTQRWSSHWLGPFKQIPWRPRDQRDPATRRRENFHDALDFGAIGLLQVDDDERLGGLWGSPIGDELPHRWTHPIEDFLVAADLGSPEPVSSGGEFARAGLLLSSAGFRRRTGSGFGSQRSYLGSRRVRPPLVRAGAVTVSGRLPAALVHRWVRPRFPRFRACYEGGLDNNPSLRGDVIVRFVISANGEVGSFAGGGSMPDGDVVRCVVEAFDGLTFPAPDAGLVRVTYPIVFDDTGGAASG